MQQRQPKGFCVSGLFSWIRVLGKGQLLKSRPTFPSLVEAAAEAMPMAAPNAIVGIEQLEAELLRDDDDEEFELPESVLFDEQVVGNNAAVSLDNLVQHNELASVLPSGEQLLWPLAEAKSLPGVGALGAPLLRSEFVSEFVQIRQFKERCLAQLRVRQNSKPHCSIM